MAGVLDVLLVQGAASWPPGLASLLGPVAPLSLGWSLVPLTGERRSRLEGSMAVLDGFTELTPAVWAVAAEASAHGPVVYVHEEFHGGHGWDEVVAWSAHEVVFGPCFTATSEGEALHDGFVVVGRGDGAVDLALQHLGIERGQAGDEYAAIGLDRHRWTDDWDAAAR